MSDTPGYLVRHLSTPGTTTVRSGAGILHTVVVNRLGAAASTVTVQIDGSPVAVIATGGTGAIAPATCLYDAFFASSLTIQE